MLLILILMLMLMLLRLLLLLVLWLDLPWWLLCHARLLAMTLLLLCQAGRCQKALTPSHAWRFVRQAPQQTPWPLPVPVMGLQSQSVATWRGAACQRGMVRASCVTRVRARVRVSVQAWWREGLMVQLRWQVLLRVAQVKQRQQRAVRARQS